MWGIQVPNTKPQNSATKDCPQAFHALRAAENAKQPDAPNDQKNLTLENSPANSYKPASDADESDPETSHKCRTCTVA